MKAISLTQPWATLVARGIKQFETRSWSTNYRGPLAIHAAKGFPGYAQEFAAEERALGRLPPLLPRGALIAIVQLVACVRTEACAVTVLERRLGDYSPGRFAWQLDGVVALPDPIPYRGRLGLFDVDIDPKMGVLKAYLWHGE